MRPGRGRVSRSLIGQPPTTVLQLRFAEPPSEPVSRGLDAFAARAAHALRASERSREADLELERTRALLALVAHSQAELSLSHALESTLDRVVELLGADRVAVYLREDDRLETAAARGLAGPHLPVAERLLELALGRYRGRGLVTLPDATSSPELAAHRARLAEAGIEAALAVPLVLPDEVTGLLAVYPPRDGFPNEHEQALVAAIAAQLSVAVQNARLHEQATEARAKAETALASERQSARRLEALYEISRSFAESLSLQDTLDAVARTVVKLLEVDGAVIRMPDARGELLVPRALHVADDRVDEALRSILSRPQRVERIPTWSAFRSGEPIVLDPDVATRLGPPHRLLVPFLEKGSTAVILPIATPSELLGTLKLLSLDPDRPITTETVDLGLSVAAQAALAINSARLHHHQKEFADTIQRSLLPRSRPELEGIELGDIYQASALVDVGGDVYDYLELDDGRLAVVLGDVTGHGIDAAADMAMAKFVFRSLAREHPEPGRLPRGRERGRVRRDRARQVHHHALPHRRSVHGGGEVRRRRTSAPAARASRRRRPGARRGRARARDRARPGLRRAHDRPRRRGRSSSSTPTASSRHGATGSSTGPTASTRCSRSTAAVPAAEIARMVIEDCRSWAHGQLADDCAVVVIKRR